MVSEEVVMDEEVARGRVIVDDDEVEEKGIDEKDDRSLPVEELGSPSLNHGFGRCCYRFDF